MSYKKAHKTKPASRTGGGGRTLRRVPRMRASLTAAGMRSEQELVLQVPLPFGKQKPSQGIGSVSRPCASPVPRPLARTIPFFCNTNVDPFTRLETTATLKPSETAAGPGLGDPPSPAVAPPTIIPTAGRCCQHKDRPTAQRFPSFLSSQKPAWNRQLLCGIRLEPQAPPTAPAAAESPAPSGTETPAVNSTGFMRSTEAGWRPREGGRAHVFTVRLSQELSEKLFIQKCSPRKRGKEPGLCTIITS